MSNDAINGLRSPLNLPCGKVLKNRIAKSAMSDSLGDGEGNPTLEQTRLYEIWAQGGVAVSFIGEVQFDPRYAEKPGNLLLSENSDKAMLKTLAKAGSINGAQLWPQLGHAGALAHAPISKPKGPSALDLEGLSCEELSLDEIGQLAKGYCTAATIAKEAGFGGVHIHAGHGFLLSQFLSPLFNHRTDQYGGSINNRARLLLEIIAQVRNTVGPEFPVGVRINSTDKLDGGLTADDGLEIIRLLDTSSVDLIDISGGTYFPGAKASSDGTAQGPYFLEFAKRAKQVTSIPLMLTGGFKRREQAYAAITSGAIDVIGVARALVLDPQLADTWLSSQGGDPKFPRFKSTPTGGVTAWYSMCLTNIAENQAIDLNADLEKALIDYEQRDALRCVKWLKKFKY